MSAPIGDRRCASLTMCSVLIEHPNDIPETDITSGNADIFFEILQLQPVSLEISFMRTDRVNVDEK